MMSGQAIALAEMTVPFLRIVHEPWKADRLRPAGTPVLPGPGQQPPHGSGPPGVLRAAEQPLPSLAGGAAGGLDGLDDDGDPAGVVCPPEPGACEWTLSGLLAAAAPLRPPDGDVLVVGVELRAPVAAELQQPADPLAVDPPVMAGT
jgi:hypothetical protein